MGESTLQTYHDILSCASICILNLNIIKFTNSVYNRTHQILLGEIKHYNRISQL